MLVGALFFGVSLLLVFFLRKEGEGKWLLLLSICLWGLGTGRRGKNGEEGE